MFDPDNFYEILRCSYSWPKTPNILFQFIPHGNKMLENLNELASGDIDNLYASLSLGGQAVFGKIVLHDQEPFSFNDAVYTYKQYLIKNKTHPRAIETIDFLDPGDFFSIAVKSGVQPIICHSEKNSDDIEAIVNDGLMIDCYYWYHGMISRDWFRHWHHHPDLLPQDRRAAPYRFLMYARGLDGSREYRKKFIDIMHLYRNQILYDWGRQAVLSPDYSAKIDVDDANQSSIQIVLETLFDTKKIHLTEKIFKPMVMSQPFFLLSGPGSLKYLRDYGFRTFGDFWDETYDDIVDSDARMAAIIKEIDNLSTLSDKNFKSLYKSLLPIIIHNREHFFSQEFQDICIKEMRKNFRQALNLQKENILVYPGGTFTRLVSKIIDANIYLSDHWTPIVRDFLRSDFLFVPREKIFEKYPKLVKFYN